MRGLWGPTSRSWDFPFWRRPPRSSSSALESWHCTESKPSPSDRSASATIWYSRLSSPSGGFFLAFNLVAAALALAVGAPESIGYHWTVPPVEAFAVFLAMLIVAGAVEEILFRGYLQTKLIASLDGPGRRRIAIGVMVASLLFAAYHIPRVLIDGAPDGMGGVEYLLMLTGAGIAYGVLYEFTHNLLIPILIHAAGNMPGTAGILFVVPMGWPLWAVLVQNLAYLGLVVAVIVLYRRWGHDSGRFPVWDRRASERATG